MNSTPDKQVLLRSATLVGGVFLIGGAMSSLFVLKLVGLKALYLPAIIQFVVGLLAIGSWFLETDYPKRLKILICIGAIVVLNLALAIVLFFQNVESLRTTPKSLDQGINTSQSPAENDSA